MTKRINTARALAMKKRATRPAMDRFLEKVEKAPSSCWLWTGSRDRWGYGKFWFGGRLVKAHRFVYEIMVGAIPQDLTIDHLCKTPACVNPEHLEIVTMKENILRGHSPSAINARKTYCPEGHPYIGANLITYPNGFRKCRACLAGRQRERYSVRRTKLLARAHRPGERKEEARQ